MSKRWGIRRLAVVLFVCLCALHFTIPAWAEEGKTVTIVIPYSDNERETDVRIGQVQKWLGELGYYDGSQSMAADAETRFALFSFCQENGLPYSETGVTEEAWELLQSGKGKAAPAESEPSDYHDIAYGAQGDDVLAFQSRLKELGYYTGEDVLVAGVFDESTQRALDLFCEENHISNSGTGASASLQYILFSSGAVAYEEPEVKRSLAERLGGYFTRQVPMLGSTLPIYLLWVCGIVLLVLILVLVVYFFVPGRENAANGQNRTEQPRYWRKAVSGPTGAGLGAIEKLSKFGSLDFQVYYNGGVTNVQCVCRPSISIGRGGGNQILLNAADTAASNSHCDLYYRGAVLMIRDHSSNGTTVNGRELHKSECRLNAGDRIGIGSHVLVIQF